MEKVYFTLVRNQGERRLHLALDFNADNYVHLEPSEEKEVRGLWWSPFSPYKEITYLKNGKVKCKKRSSHKYHWDKDQFILRARNSHDRIENYKLGSPFYRSYTIPHGPEEVQLPIFVLDALCDWKSVVIFPDKVIHEMRAGFIPVGVIPSPGTIEVNDRSQRLIANLEFQKRSKPERQRIQELRDEIRMNDPEIYKYHYSLSSNLRERWRITKQMLLTEQERKERQKKLEEQRKLEEEASLSFEDFR